MIIVACILVGLAMRLLAGLPLRDLERTRIVGEYALIALLLAQAILPVVRISGQAQGVVFYAWIATFPVLVAIAAVNHRNPGMRMIAVGLALNLAVILANGGMPVMPAAAEWVRPGVPLLIPPADFVHVVGSPSTRLALLADVIPLPGPRLLSSVLSAGDVLLFSGIVAFIGAAKGNTTH